MTVRAGVWRLGRTDSEVGVVCAAYRTLGANVDAEKGRKEGSNSC